MKGNGIERDTLDGVITALEKVDDTWQNGRNGLQYADLRDALHYLKAYRKLDSLDAVAFPEDDNPPLSWRELRQMEGKPVWLEVKGYNGCWTIVHWNSNIVFVEFYDWIASPDDFMKAPLVSLDDTNFGTAWQAYRKERE